MAGGLLETFFILFDSDAKKVEKEADKAGHATERLTERINLGHGAAIRLGESLHETVLELGAMVGGLLAIGASIEGIKQAEEYAAKLNDTSETLGISVENLSAWGDAAHHLGGSADGLTDSLARLTASLAQVDVTGKSRAAPFFQSLGIQMLDANGKGRPVLDLLTDLAGKFEGMDKQESLGLGRKLGLDDGTIRLLQQGKQGLTDLVAKTKEYGVITTEQSEVADKFDKQLDWTKLLFRTLALEVGTPVLEAFTKFLEGLQKVLLVMKELPQWLRENSEYFKTLGYTIGFVATIITAAMIPAIIEMGATLAAWLVKNELLLAIMAGLLQATAIGFLLNILLVAALAAGFFFVYLVLDDIRAFIGGEDSYLGRGLVRIGELIDGLAPKTRKWLTILYDIAKIMANLATLNFKGALIEGLKFAVDLKSLRMADANPINSQSSGSILRSGNSKTTVVQIDQINMQTQAQSIDMIAQHFADSLQQHIKQTTANYDDGVR